MATSFLNLSSGYGGQCLKWVRLAFGIRAKYGTAWQAWNGAEFRFGDEAPANVPVFFKPSSNGFGHVAYGLGGGRVRTTNSATNKIYNTTIASLASSWRQPYVGWTADLNGVLVDGTQVTATLSRGAKGRQVRFLQIRLRRSGHYGGAIDDSFGPQTDSAVRAFQTSRGLSADGSVGPKTRQRLNDLR